MGGVVQGALGQASNMVGGLPIVGGMAKSAIGQGGSMLGMPPQGQQGGQGGGLMGGKGGGQGGPGGMLGGLMGGGGKGGQDQSGMQRGAWFGQNNPNNRPGYMGPPGSSPGWGGSGGGTWAERHPGGGTGRYATQSAPQGGQTPGWGNNFGMGQPQTLAQRRIADAHRQPGQPATAQTAQLSSDFKKQYGM